MTHSILIVDDHAASLEFLVSALRSTGVTIYQTQDPEEALRLVRQHRPRIVLTDLVMPKLTGIELLEQIRAFDPAIDVILMTAHYTTETAVDAIKKGAADYLNKPISVSVLRERVKLLLADIERREAALAPIAFTVSSAAAPRCWICLRDWSAWRRTTGRFC